MSKITKLQDAVDVVGPEMKSEVEELEKKTSLAMLEKSHFDELVEKSVVEAETEVAKDALAVQDELINPVREFYKIFYKLVTENGVKITEDELSLKINELLQGLTDRSEVTPPENTEKVDETVFEKSEAEVVEKGESWMPYAGATTLAEAKAYNETNDLLNKVYYAYSVFGALASNIMNSEGEVSGKVERLNSLFGEFQKNLTPEKLKELSEVEKMDITGVDAVESVKAELAELKSVVDKLVGKTETEVQPAIVPETKVEKTEAVLPLTQTFDELLKSALGQDGDARKAGLQDILNRMGNEFLTLTQEVPVQKSEGQEILRALVDEKLKPIEAQMNQMGAALNSIALSLNNVGKNNPTLMATPVQKAQVTMPGNLVAPVGPPPSNGAGMSIRDLVKKTTTG